MSVRDSVHQFLKDNAGEGYTNDQIAAELVIPEASVRRATLRLERENKIHFDNVASRGRLLWKVQRVDPVQRPATV